ncbi:MAG: hypothetical protein AB7Q81_23280 [Gammaproteobacteria bacterium]
MKPSIELRLRTMMRAMSEVIVPAIDADNSLAREQAQLMFGHLNALLRHHTLELRVDAHEDAAARELARALLDAGGGGARTMAARDALTAALAGADADALAHALERLVIAAGADGEPALHAASARLVLDHARRQNRLGRAWFKPMGFDARPDELPDPATLLEDDVP